jgi:hypothetical protein
MVKDQNFNSICIERDDGWAGDQWCTGVQLGVWDTVSWILGPHDDHTGTEDHSGLSCLGPH